MSTDKGGLVEELLQKHGPLTITRIAELLDYHIGSIKSVIEDDDMFDCKLIDNIPKWFLKKEAMCTCSQNDHQDAAVYVDADCPTHGNMKAGDPPEPDLSSIKAFQPSKEIHELLEWMNDTMGIGIDDVIKQAQLIKYTSKLTEEQKLDYHGRESQIKEIESQYAHKTTNINTTKLKYVMEELKRLGGHNG